MSNETDTTEKEFIINCEEVRVFTIKVKGEDLEDAISKVESEPSIYVNEEKGEYLDGSFKSRPYYLLESQME